MIVPSEDAEKEIPEKLWDQVFEACNARLNEMIKENEILEAANRRGGEVAECDDKILGGSNVGF